MFLTVYLQEDNFERIYKVYDPEENLPSVKYIVGKLYSFFIIFIYSFFFSRLKNYWIYIFIYLNNVKWSLTIIQRHGKRLFEVLAGSFEKMKENKKNISAFLGRNVEVCYSSDVDTDICWSNELLVRVCIYLYVTIK